MNMTQTMNYKIQRGFSRSAGNYDRFSSLHREIADKLWSQVNKESQTLSLLDVGCGTGYLTQKARKYFSQCRVIGLDLAFGMLQVARLKDEDIFWVQGDGNQLPFSDGSFDLLISNLAYQWSLDLTQALSEARRVLSKDGRIACTLFGFNTCQELFQSLYEAKEGTMQFNRLPHQEQVRQAFGVSGFKDITVECEQLKINFKDMHALMGWLKTIGANHLAREGYLGQKALARAQGIYHERFANARGVVATFEVIGVYAKK